MEKTMNTNIRHYFNHLTCTIFLALGLMGLFATASQAAKDTTAPNVSITSPTSGTIVTSAKTVRIAASASDNVGIRKVHFYDGTTLLKNDTTSPYYFDWPVTSAKNGIHNLTAKAYDAAGNLKVSSAVTVTVNIPTQDLSGPTVSLTSPAAGTTFTSAQTVRIAAATSSTGVRKVDFYNGTTLLKNDTTSPYFVDWAITSANNGSHNLTAKAYDAAGKSTVSAVTVTVNIPAQDLSVPTVSLTSPAAGTTFTSAQTVTIAANASDNVGVSRVEFYNGATLLKDDTISPYDVAWAISSTNNGSHTLTAKAYDAAGNSKVSTAVTVTVNIPVQNLSAPTVSLTSPTAGTTFTTAQTVRIAATTNSTGVSKVDLYNGTTLLKNDTTAPYYFDWAITSANNGNHNLTAKAYDAAGNSTVSSVTVTVNIPVQNLSTSTVSVTSPTAGTTFTTAQTVRIAATTSITGVSKVDFYNGTTLLKNDTTSPYFVDWAITSANNGSHNLSAKAYDAAGNVTNAATVAININIAVDAPTYAAPVLNYVQASGSDFLLGWSQPPSTYGAPAGGYDIFSDGVDGNNHTMEQTTVISGLPAGEHCFEVEARWTQAVPATYPLSNRICAVSEGSTPPPASADLGPLKVFPGAKGFGTTSVAGRGGQIIKVTNLNDSGAGSLRAAVEATGPRVIVFEVSGRINLLTNLSVKNPFITIAGQTAPAPGVMVTGRTFIVTTHDVLVQHLAIRVGDEDKLDDSGRTADAIQITGTSAYNIVFDHVSASWAIDEIIGIGYGIKDITFSNCLIAEGLNNSIHPKGAHGYGILLADNSTRISLVGILLAHVQDRLPRVAGGDFLLVNNVFYNKGGGDFSGIGSAVGIATRMSVVGNLFLEGPDGVPGNAIVENSTLTAAGSAIYQKDNAYPGGTVFRGSHGVSSPPAAAWISGLTYTTDPLNQVKTSVLKNVGSRPAFRDAVDKRIIADVVNKTGRIIDSQRDVGGFPVLAQNKATFNAGTNPHGDDNRNGYTNLEEILYQMAAQVEGR